jgi:hypothetical protein
MIGLAQALRWAAPLPDQVPTYFATETQKHGSTPGLAQVLQSTTTLPDQVLPNKLSRMIVFLAECLGSGTTISRLQTLPRPFAVTTCVSNPIVQPTIVPLPKFNKVK